MSFFQRLRRSEWLAIRFQIGLGCVFLAAAWPKILQPPMFAKNVWAYQLLPDVLITSMAIFLPWVELVVGLALVLGIRPRAASWLSILLLAQFTVALAINAFIRENPVNCSCFELNPAPKTCAMLLWDMKELVLRDIAFILLALHIAWARGPAADKPDIDTPALGLAS